MNLLLLTWTVIRKHWTVNKTPTIQSSSVIFSIWNYLREGIKYGTQITDYFRFFILKVKHYQPRRFACVANATMFLPHRVPPGSLQRLWQGNPYKVLYTTGEILIFVGLYTLASLGRLRTKWLRKIFGAQRAHYMYLASIKILTATLWEIAPIGPRDLASTALVSRRYQLIKYLRRNSI